MKSVKHYFCPIPFNKMKMKNLSALIALFAVLVLTGCGKFGKSSKGLPNDGQLHGVAPASKYNLTKPPGMVYIPPGTFHMGPSDEDVNYAFTARNKQISINGFWMDATEITNNEYRQFVNWVRDSVGATLMQMGKEVDGRFTIDWKKAQTIKWGDKATIEKVDQMILTPENRIFGKKDIDPYYRIVSESRVREITFCSRLIIRIAEITDPNECIRINEHIFLNNEL